MFIRTHIRAKLTLELEHSGPFILLAIDCASFVHIHENNKDNVLHPTRSTFFLENRTKEKRISVSGSLRIGSRSRLEFIHSCLMFYLSRAIELVIFTQCISTINLEQSAMTKIRIEFHDFEQRWCTESRQASLVQWILFP